MLCDLLIDLLTVICYMVMCYVQGCLAWGLTRYVWLFYDLLCYVCILCYGPEGIAMWTGRLWPGKAYVCN